jgi:hypothetical protein
MCSIRQPELESCGGVACGRRAILAESATPRSQDGNVFGSLNECGVPNNEQVYVGVASSLAGLRRVGGAPMLNGHCSWNAQQGGSRLVRRGCG